MYYRSFIANFIAKFETKKENKRIGGNEVSAQIKS